MARPSSAGSAASAPPFLVFERRSVLQVILRRVDESPRFPIALIEDDARGLDQRVSLAHSEEPARADHNPGDGLAVLDNEIFNLANRFILIVVYRRADQA